MSNGLMETYHQINAWSGGGRFDNPRDKDEMVARTLTGFRPEPALWSPDTGRAWPLTSVLSLALNLYDPQHWELTKYIKVSGISGHWEVELTPKNNEWPIITMLSRRGPVAVVLASLRSISEQVERLSLSGVIPSNDL